jgi:hypothetical protein
VAIAKRLYVWGPNATREGAEEIFHALWPGCRHVWVHSVPKPDMSIRFRVIGLFGFSGGPKRGSEPPSVDPGTDQPKSRRSILDEPNEKVMVSLMDVDPETFVAPSGVGGGGQIGGGGRPGRGYERKNRPRRGRAGSEIPRPIT